MRKFVRCIYTLEIRRCLAGMNMCWQHISSHISRTKLKPYSHGVQTLIAVYSYKQRTTNSAAAFSWSITEWKCDFLWPWTYHFIFQFLTYKLLGRQYRMCLTANAGITLTAFKLTFKFQLHHPLALRPWARYLNFLSFHFFIYKIGTIINLTNRVW